MTKLSVIDLFAGPGGLSEGFSSIDDFFRVAISIEKESSAHKTLLLRAFYRQFKSPPKEYFEFLKGKLGNCPEEQLYDLFPKESAAARREAKRLELGKDNNKEVFSAIDSAVGKKPSILIGGPPCQAYSLAGRVSNRNAQGYTPETDQRNFLYQEYLQVVARYQPLVFVMENVKGMLSAKVAGKPIFEQILADLQNPAKATNTMPHYRRRPRDYVIVPFVSPEISNVFGEYAPSDFVIRSEQYGIPQKRHRVILLGVRADIAKHWSASMRLERTEQLVSVESVIRDLPALRSGFSKQENTAELWREYIAKRSHQLASQLKKEGLRDIAQAYSELPFRLDPKLSEQGQNLGLRKNNRRRLLCHQALREWYSSDELNDYVLNHQSRTHIAQDLDRYLFCSLWAEKSKELAWDSTKPKSKDFPRVLWPAHKNFDSGKFADRFRVQVKGEPANTITSHISKDGHHFIHYDPSQCRSFTVREAARIQTFPDDYFFLGNRTQQYVQVGNAVPPWLAKQIAESVKKLISCVL